MPLLDAAQRAALRTEVHEPSITDEQVVDVYRNPVVSGGKTGAPVLFQADMATRIRPVGQAASMTRLLQQTFPLVLPASRILARLQSIPTYSRAMSGSRAHDATR
jgi:hypothetical protein